MIEVIYAILFIHARVFYPVLCIIPELDAQWRPEHHLTGVNVVVSSSL